MNLPSETHDWIPNTTCAKRFARHGPIQTRVLLIHFIATCHMSFSGGDIQGTTLTSKLLENEHIIFQAGMVLHVVPA